MINRQHLVLARLRTKGAKDEAIYLGDDGMKANAAYEKAQVDPKYEVVGLAMNIPFLRMQYPRAQAVNATARASVPRPTT